MRNGRYALQGEFRNQEVNWQDIFNEWNEGIGPEYSYFEGNNPSATAIRSNYLYVSAKLNFDRSNKNKSGATINFYPWDIVGQGVNMHGQMMGSFNVSFYKMGDKTLSLVQDSKSRTSFYYHLPWIENRKRGNYYEWNRDAKSWYGINKETNTYQTYLFFDNYKNN